MNVDVVRNALHRLPFRPFTLRLADNRALYVPHPDFVATGNRIVIVVNPADDTTAMIEPLLIVSLDYVGDVPPPVPPTSNGGPAAGAPAGS